MLGNLRPWTHKTCAWDCHYVGFQCEDYHIITDGSHQQSGGTVSPNQCSLCQHADGCQSPITDTSQNNPGSKGDCYVDPMDTILFTNWESDVYRCCNAA